MARIALFGGAFDPPHLGHVLCACYAWQTVDLDAIWVLPSAHHPWGKQMRPFADRLAMCSAAFADFPFVEVHRDEEDNTTGRTFDLLNLLDERYPQHQQHKWWFIGGSDTEQQLPSWYKGEELAERMQVIPVPRRGFDDEHPAALPAISSSAVREHLTNNQSIAGLVPATVANLIEQHGWYRS